LNIFKNLLLFFLGGPGTSGWLDNGFRPANTSVVEKVGVGCDEGTEDGFGAGPSVKLLACGDKGPWLSGRNCGVPAVFDVGPGGAVLDVGKTSACEVAGTAPGPSCELVRCLSSKSVLSLV